MKYVLDPGLPPATWKIDGRTLRRSSLTQATIEDAIAVYRAKGPGGTAAETVVVIPPTLHETLRRILAAISGFSLEDREEWVEKVRAKRRPKKKSMVGAALRAG